MARLLGRINSVRDWYRELSLGEKGVVCLAIGNVWGTLYGTHVRRMKLRTPESDFLVATSYMVKEEEKKAFELAWSDAARLAQRQPGYEWTKTYKALDWEDSPFHYISFRMWSEESCYRRFITHDGTWKLLMDRLKNCLVSDEKSTVYKVIVDDSVRRIIP
mmetsp:Transcript_57411/g.124208  ORF Transcript_57411/g.124208 Transcript_57411/m.124208 type:complete len:161 (-) Transcript_57411:133-615(-)